MAAECLRPGHRVPSGRAPAPVGVGPARRGGHLAGLELDAVLVADPVQRRQHVAGETPGFLQHGGGEVGVKIAIMAGLHGGLKARAMVEGEQDVVDRRTVGHDCGLTRGNGSREPPSSHETAIPSTPERGSSCRGGRAVICGPDWLGRRARVSMSYIRDSGADRSGAVENPISSLLKWFNSLYRPSLPEEIRAAIVPPLSGQLIGASPSGKAVDFDSTMRRFKSSRPSQAVTASEKPAPRLAERPTIAGLLRFCGLSPNSRIHQIRGQFAESLQPQPRIFPFLGD